MSEKKVEKEFMWNDDELKNVPKKVWAKVT